MRARSSTNVIQPNEEGQIEVTMDTRNFVGTKAKAFYVTLEYGVFAVSRLWVQANSRSDLDITPIKLEFGKIPRGKAAAASTKITISDNPKLQITSATCTSKFIQVAVKEVERTTNRVAYQVSATIQAGIPDGKLQTEIELSTDNPAFPRVLVPLYVEVVSPR